jgi:hypothetical protein
MNCPIFPLSIAEVEPSAGASMEMPSLAEDQGSINDVKYPFGERLFSPDPIIGLQWKLTAFQFIGHKWGHERKCVVLST